MKALVIGGQKGLGAGITTALKKEGYKVCSMSRRTDPPLDLMWKPNKINTAVKEALMRVGDIDVLVVSSGMGAYKHPLDPKIEEMIQTNYVSPILVFKAAYKSLLKTKGKACFITSTCSRRPGSGGLSIYGSTKAAINSFVINEGRRAAKREVALFAVAPGWFTSPMVESLNPNVEKKIIEAIPFKRFGTIDEVAMFTVSLLQQSNWCLAGQVFECSGGA